MSFYDDEDDVRPMEYYIEDDMEPEELEERLDFLMRKADLDEAVSSWSY